VRRGFRGIRPILPRPTSGGICGCAWYMCRRLRARDSRASSTNAGEGFAALLSRPAYPEPPRAFTLRAAARVRRAEVNVVFCLRGINGHSAERRILRRLTSCLKGAGTRSKYPPLAYCAATKANARSGSGGETILIIFRVAGFLRAEYRNFRPGSRVASGSKPFVPKLRAPRTKGGSPPTDLRRERPRRPPTSR